MTENESKCTYKLQRGAVSWPRTFSTKHSLFSFVSIRSTFQYVHYVNVQIFFIRISAHKSNETIRVVCMVILYGII